MALTNAASRQTMLEPIFEFTTITPSDTVVYELHRGFHVNTDGNVTFIDASGTSRLVTVKAGMYYPYGFTKIMSTGTTATVLGLKFNSAR